MKGATLSAIGCPILRFAATRSTKGPAPLLHGEERHGHEPAAVRAGEVPEPVVVGARQRPRRVGVPDEREVLREEGWEEERAVHTHRVHVPETRGRILRTRRDRMALVG